jgi:fibronectin type 3 domain-containing protein
MRSSIVFLSLFLFLNCIPLFAQNCLLVKVDLSQVADRNSLEHVKIPIYHRQGDILFIGIDSKHLPTMQNLTYSILDYSFDPSLTYIITSEKRKPVKWNSIWGTKLWENDSELILKTNADITKLLINTEYMAILFPSTPTDFKNRIMMAPPLNRLMRTEIQELVNQVNSDSIGSYIQHLQDFGTRYYANPNQPQIANWIRDQFLRWGYTDVEVTTFEISGIPQLNVIATLPGVLTPNKNIVVGAHSDDNISFGGDDPMIFCPGADDNASGVAAVLETARVFKLMNYQPACTFRFVTFACEEMGLFGSANYAQYLLNSQAQVKLMINHDMIATHDDNYPSDYVILQPYSGFDSYTQFAANMTITYTNLVPLAGSYDSAGSDSYNFWLRGYPSIYFEELDFSPYYHTINDLFSHLDMNFCSRVVKSSLASGATMSSMPDPIEDFLIQDTGLGNSLQISWDASTEPNITGYKVYVADSTDVWDQVIPVNDTITTIENLVEGTNYYIGLSCMNAQNFESLITVKQGSTYFLPQTPTNLADYPQVTSIDLIWDSNQELDIAGYNVYRSTIQGQLGTLLNSTLIPHNMYHDWAVEDGIYYYYTVEAVDDTGNSSGPSAQLYSRCISLNQGVMIIDGTANGSGSTYMQPSDTQVDDYYNNLLSQFQKTQYDLSENANLKLADFGAYSTIIWHCNSITGIEQAYSLRAQIELYLDYGGNLLISTYNPTLAWDMNTTYPQTFEAGDFLYDIFKINGVNYSNSARFKYAIPNDIEFPELAVDSLKSSAGLNHHIFRIEGLSAAPGGTVLYTYGSDYANNTSQGVLNGMAVGIGYFGNFYKSVILSFPLWNMNFDQAKQMVEYILVQRFNEPVGNDDTTTPVMSINKLEQNYPNPFKMETTIKYSLAKQSHAVLDIYNVKGQKVRSLITGLIPKGNNTISWNGKDDQGKQVASGVYFYHLETGNVAFTRKMLLIK